MTLKGKILCLVIPLALLWLFTGGCVVYTSHWIIPVHPKGKTQFTPFIFCEWEGKEERKGIPFLFWSESSGKPPYSLHFSYITHNVVENATITVEKLSLEYEDGSSTDLRPLIGKEIRPRATQHAYIDENRDWQSKPSLQAELIIPDSLPEWKPCALKVVCQLRAGNRVVEQCDLSMKIKRYTQTKTMTGWSWVLWSLA